MIRLCAALLLALLALQPARADDVAEAKARFRRGVELYRQKKWREAMAEFEAAYRLKPHGAIQFNVAQCRERLADWPGALRSYEDYLREVPAAPDRAAVRASTKRIEERLARAGLQALVVYSDPAGAKVALDGAERGTTPLHLALAPGSYALSLSLDGHEPLTEQLAIAATASRVVDVVLRPARPVAAPAPEPPAVAGAPAPAAPDLAPRPPSAPAPVPLAPAPPRARPWRTAAWVAAGTAVVATAAGAYLGWSARQDERAIAALSAPDRAAASRRARDAESKANAANALYAVAGGAATAGLTLFVLDWRF
jgi:tetratricopeptide (TPR) repeat protein